MFRSRLILLSLLSLALYRQPAAAAPDASWLPATTVAYVSVPKVDHFLTAARSTSLGKLFTARAFQPFWQSVWDNQETDPWSVAWLLGLTLEEVRQTASGPVTLALVAGEGRSPALILLLDAQQKPGQAEALLRQVTGRFGRIGATRSQVGPATVYDLPPRSFLGALRRLAFAVQDGILIASTQPALVPELLARRPAQGSSLADNPVFQATTGRALKETPGAMASWFFDPLAFWQAWRGLLAEKVKGVDWLATLKKEGYTAVKGLGGAIRIDPATGELVLRGFLRAPRPYQRSMRMMAFTDEAGVQPPPWVPRDVALFGTVSVQAAVAFEAYSTLFDTLFGEGEEGVFEEVIKGLKDDPVGPRVDLRKELLARFRSPLWFLDWPGQASNGDTWVIGCPVEQPPAVARAVDRLFQGDRAARRLAFAEHGLWQVQPEKVPANGNGQNSQARPADLGNGDWTLPASAIGVTRETLLLAGSPDLVRRLFGRSQPLAQDADYRRTTAALDRLAGKSSLRSFFRLGPLLRQTLTELRESKPRPNGGIDFRRLPGPDEVASELTGDGGLSARMSGDSWSFVLILGAR